MKRLGLLCRAVLEPVSYTHLMCIRDRVHIYHYFQLAIIKENTDVFI